MHQNTVTFSVDSASSQQPMPLTIAEASATGTNVKVSVASAKIRISIDVFTEDEDHISLDELLDISVYRRRITPKPLSEAYQTMLASEVVLRRDWDRPEEDEAWADL